MIYFLIKIKIRINGHLHKEEEDGKIGGDRHSNVELHCLHLTKQANEVRVSKLNMYHDHYCIMIMTKQANEVRVDMSRLSENDQVTFCCSLQHN